MQIEYPWPSFFNFTGTLTETGPIKRTKASLVHTAGKIRDVKHFGLQVLSLSCIWPYNNSKTEYGLNSLET